MLNIRAVYKNLAIFLDLVALFLDRLPELVSSLVVFGQLQKSSLSLSLFRVKMIMFPAKGIEG